MRRELASAEAASPPRLAVRSVEMPQPGTGEVLVRVQATSVNPIDVKRAAGTSRAPKATCAWTLFKPDRDALEALAEGFRARRLALPIGIAVPFDNAIAAFDHVSAGLPGRAVILP